MEKRGDTFVYRLPTQMPRNNDILSLWSEMNTEKEQNLLEVNLFTYLGKSYELLENIHFIITSIIMVHINEIRFPIFIHAYDMYRSCNPPFRSCPFLFQTPTVC